MRTILTIGILLAVVAHAALAAEPRTMAAVQRQADVIVLANSRLVSTFNLASGAWQVARGDGSVFASDLRCSISASGSASTTSGTRRATDEGFTDKFGAGRRVTIRHDNPTRPFELVLSLYDDAPFLLVQVRIPNARGIRVQEVTVPEGRLYVGQDVRRLCTISNYWSGEWYTEIHPVDLSEHRNRWETYSHFFLVAHNRGDGAGGILGPLFSRGTSRVEASVDPQRDPNALFFRSRCYYDRNPLTVESDTWESAPWVLGAPAHTLEGMETYGALALAHRPYPMYPHPPSGWCSWDAGASDSQKALYANVDAMKANRLDEFGLKWVQLDDGWQQGGRNTTTWRPILSRFPDGMKGVADYIRAKGFEPGLWIAPFSRQNLGDPKFPQWLADEMRLFTQEWGFHYIKADFLSYPHSFRNDSIPYDVAYYRGVQVMKEATDAVNGYLMTCINHEWLTVGVADGQRLGNDVHGGDLTGLYVTLKCWPRRYFTNNTFWVGDPDMLHVNLPTDEQSQVWASFVALSGGATMSGDSIPSLKPSRIDIMKKVYPAQGITARPADLFDRPSGWAPKYPRIWNAVVDKPGIGRWNVVGLFNWTVDHRNFHGEPQNVTVDFATHLNLRPDRRYLVYDFWGRKYLGAFEKSLSVGLGPASCLILIVREESTVPQVLATDRYVISGSEDLRKVSWDAATRTLSGQTQTVKNIDYELTVHVPAGLAATAAIANGQTVELEKHGEFAVRLRTSTGPAGRIDWSIRFNSQPGRPAPLEPTAASLLSRVEVPMPDVAAAEIPLRRIAPLWTDQRHDIEGGPISSAKTLDLGTTAPFFMAWDISPYSRTHTRLKAECVSTGGRVFFEVLADGKRIWASDVLADKQSATVDVSVAGAKQLELLCHYVDGWFSSTRASWRQPRLTRKE